MLTENKATRSKKFFWITGILVLCLLGGTAAYAKTKKVEFVEKNVINMYVCKIVAADPDKDMFAVQCMAR